jgi:hypothetical protein
VCRLTLRIPNLGTTTRWVASSAVSPRPTGYETDGQKNTCPYPESNQGRPERTQSPNYLSYRGSTNSMQQIIQTLSSPRKSPASYRTPKFIALFITAREWSWTQSRAKWIKFTSPQSVFLRSHLILFSFPNDVFPSTACYMNAFLISDAWHIIAFFLQPGVTSSIVGQNTFLSTLFLNTLNLCYSLNITFV